MANQTQRRASRRASQRGVVAVEFALVLPVLIPLIMGIITAGMSFNNLLGTADAVREGARFGATTASSSAWADAVLARTVDQSYTSLTSPYVCVKMVKLPSTSVWSSTCDTSKAGIEPATPSGLTAGTCIVKVWAQTDFTINAGLYQTNGLTGRQSVAAYERTC